jgi:hypothetical protein
MKSRLDFMTSPEDRATFARWLRGVVLFYGGVGLMVVAALVVARFAEIATQVAGK